MAEYLRRYAFAIACVAAPLLFGMWSSSVTVAWLLGSSHVERIKLDYRLRDQPASSSDTRAEQPGEASKSAAGSANSAAAARFELVARHFSGLVNYAITTGLLFFVCAAAVVLSAPMILRRAGPRGLALVIIGFGIVTAVETALVMGDTQRRLLMTDNIFALADRHELLKDIPVAQRMNELLALNVFVGLFAAGMVLSALALASVRRGSQVDLADLKDRLFVIRVTLILSSALLVADTLSARALVDWPISLLAEAQRRALDLAGDALTRLWAASSSVALLAAFVPGIAAWHLDRRDFRAAHPAAAPGGPPDDGLDIAPWSAVTAVLAVLAPVIVSPLLDILKSLLTTVGGH
jgi:hypothetical protein